MTLETFLRQLRKTPRTWRVTRDLKRIRNREHQCPGVAVLGSSPFYCTDTLARGVRKAIVDAADLPKLTPLRRRLLRACGLPVRRS